MGSDQGRALERPGRQPVSGVDAWIDSPSGPCDGLHDTEDQTIRTFLGRLTEAGCEWELEDHWDGDLCAVGVARPGDPGRLAYVSCWGQPPGCYHVELEVADPDEGYATTRLEEALALAEAVGLVSEHISAKEA